jgi:hypothetical protein
MRHFILICFLALIPLINWLIGIAIGLGLLKELISNRKYRRIPAALLLAFLWTICSAYWMAFVDGAIFLGIVGAALLVTLTYVLINFVGQPSDGYKRQLNLANATGAGNFSDDCAFGDANEGPLVFIDRETRKIAIIWDDQYKIEPLEFIKTWELNWTEKNSNGIFSIVNVYIKIQTTSFDMPIFKVPMESKMDGEQWVQRLNLIFNNT